MFRKSYSRQWPGWAVWYFMQYVILYQSDLGLSSLVLPKSQHIIFPLPTSYFLSNTMKSCLIVSLLVVLGIAAPSDMVAVLAAPDEMDMTLANVDRDMAEVKMPEAQADAANAKSNLRRAASTTTPYSQSVITWGAGSKTCAGAATSVIISCPIGGKISLDPNAQSGVSSCTNVGTNAVTCTKVASAETAHVTAKCTGKYLMTALVSRHTFTNCDSSATDNSAYQFVRLEQVCAVKPDVRSYTKVFSSSCQLSTSLYVDPVQKFPYCGSQSSNCVKTTGSTCSITPNAVSIFTPPTTSTLCIIR